LRAARRLLDTAAAAAMIASFKPASRSVSRLVEMG
jgi:hypothetical protein